MVQGKLEFCEKRMREEEDVNMVNGNPPYQKAVKSLTIFYKEKVSLD